MELPILIPEVVTLQCGESRISYEVAQKPRKMREGDSGVENAAGSRAPLRLIGR